MPEVFLTPSASHSGLHVALCAPIGGACTFPSDVVRSSWNAHRRDDGLAAHELAVDADPLAEAVQVRAGEEADARASELGGRERARGGGAHDGLEREARDDPAVLEQHAPHPRLRRRGVSGQ